MSLLRRHYALPAEHGSWIWWIGPFVIGLAAARRVPVETLWLLAAVLSGFLLRQPVAILVKALAGRRPKYDLKPALIWSGIYATFGTVAVAGLIFAGHARVLLLAIPGVLVFAWHMELIRRRADRGQMGIEIVGTGVLALAAPGAYNVAGGESTLLAGWLWSLCWLQSAASVLLVYARLEQRGWKVAPSLASRLSGLRRAYLYHAFNLAAAVALAALGWIPWLWPLASTLMLLDLIDATFRPSIGVRPTRIGLRQLVASTTFVVLVCLGFLV
ncbi:MAG TPA: YwiC-like family protein [Anaerolineales bacterium]|nr:YwiC-like family protein [Anaerolineales bacterium]